MAVTKTFITVTETVGIVCDLGTLIKVFKNMEVFVVLKPQEVIKII